MPDAVELARAVLEFSAGVDLMLSTECPDHVAAHFPEARRLVRQIEAIVHASSVKVEYFDTSKERYLHYFAAALSLGTSARTLEIGAAPGHVSIGLHLAGFASVGLNLNELWRATYPSPEWLSKLDVREHDVEGQPLPFPDRSFDCAFFTEVLEHVAISDPSSILKEICRVLVPGGLLILSTPNVCNVSNILALATGKNVFWPVELFYGSLDRHNREYTPQEVRLVVERSGFSIGAFYGINDHNNWRTGASELAYTVIAELGDKHPLLRNTILCLATTRASRV